MPIPKNHKAALFNYSETERVRYFQEGWGNGLVVDGIYGDMTAAALDDFIAGEIDAPCGSTMIAAAFKSAKADVGEHEVPMGSNNGPYVEGLRDEVDLPRLAGGEWCAVFQSVHLYRSGIQAKSRGATGVCRAMINLPKGREVDIADIDAGFYGVAVRKRGRTTHHVQIFRAFMVNGALMIEHVGGNEHHSVETKVWKFKKFFKGVTLIGTYEG